MNPLLLLSATELAARIRAGAVSAEAVVLAHIARIQAVNPRLNAMVADRFEAAVAEARAADRRLAAEGPAGLPPLHGVPCSIKESIALTGMPHTSGLVARRGVRAAADAPSVARLRRAGAIPLGVTNVSELCMWMESANRVYGRTRNPYDPGRIAGGSSGGEGAIVGAGGAPFGLGADIGGSIRMPSFFNGVFGHKPTGGLIPNTGNYPSAHGVARRYQTTGPLARRAADLWPLVRLLAGPDGEDPGCQALPLGDPATVRAERLTVLDVPDNGWLPVQPELRAAQQRAAAALAARGARVLVTRIPGFERSLSIWAAMLADAGGPSFAEWLGDGRGAVRPGRELLRWLCGRSPHTLPALGLAALERLPAALSGARGAAVAAGRALRAALSERLGPDTVLLFPPYPSVAPRHHRPLLPPWRWVYTAILNVLELPATAVPLGLGAAGLPLGVQVVAGHGRDHLSVAVAQWLEADCGGWVPPPRLA